MALDCRKLTGHCIGSRILSTLIGITLFLGGYKIPELTLFSGEGGITALEHMARFTCQCVERHPPLNHNYHSLGLVCFLGKAREMALLGLQKWYMDPSLFPGGPSLVARKRK